MPKTFASQADSDESGRKGALCRGTLVYEDDDGAQIAPYKLKILARPGRQAESAITTDDGVTHGTLSVRRPRHSPGNPARRRRAPVKRPRHVTRAPQQAAFPAMRPSITPAGGGSPAIAPRAPRHRPASLPGRGRSPGCGETPVPRRERGSLDLQPGCRCYLAFSRISTRRHRLVAESGRVSARRTRSPMPALFSSS